jgi:hypothetical protein
LRLLFGPLLSLRELVPRSRHFQHEKLTRGVLVMRHRGSNGGADMRTPAPNALTEIQRAIARALAAQCTPPQVVPKRLANLLAQLDTAEDEEPDLASRYSPVIASGAPLAASYALCAAKRAGTVFGNPLPSRGAPLASWTCSVGLDWCCP